MADVVEQRGVTRPRAGQRTGTWSSSPRASSAWRALPGQVIGAEGVFEAGVGGAWIDQKGVAQLADVPESLHRERIEQSQRGVVERDIVPERIADDLEASWAVAQTAGPAAATFWSTSVTKSAKFLRNISAQPGCLGIVTGMILPGAPGVEHLGGNPCNRARHLEPEYRILPVLGGSSLPARAAATMARV